MKPLKVSMQAFGPYNNMQVCDFTDLNNSRIFLITGPTGSGKTSILDAICFSLYGQATGTLRSFRDMRNTAAPMELDTVAAFEFSLGDKIYKFLRTVHIHKKRNGDVSEIVNGECYIKSGDEWQLIISGAEAVSKKATEIIGFDKDQFSQVVVLPQGEFRKLLVASSKEKLSILQTLFSTSIWQRIIEEFSKKSRMLSDELESRRLVIKTMLNGVECQNENELNEKIKENKQETLKAEEELNSSANMLQKAQESYNVALAGNEKLNQLKVTADELLALESLADEVKNRRVQYERLCKIKEFYPVIQRLQADENELVKCKAELDAAFADFKTAESQVALTQDMSAQVDKLKSEQADVLAKLTKLKVILPDCERLSELLQNIPDKEKLLSESIAALDKKNQEKDEYTQRVENGEKYISELFENSIKPLDSKLDEQNKVSRMLDRFELYKKCGADLEALKSDTDNALRLYNGAKAELDAAQIESERIKKILSQSKAYSLAVELKEGEKCPVCGSTHHPQPAGAPADDVNQQVVEKILSDCLENTTQKKSVLDTVTAKLELKQKEFDELKAECEGFGVSEKECVAQKNELVLFIEQANKAKKNYDTYKAKIAEFKQLIQQTQVHTKVTEDQVAALTAELSALKAQINEINSRLPENFDYKAAQTDAVTKQQRLDDVVAEITDLEKKIKLAESNYVLAKARVQSADKLYNSALVTVENSRGAVSEKLQSLGVETDTELGALIKEDSWFEAENKYLSDYNSRFSRLSDKKAELLKETEDIAFADITMLEAELRELKQENSRLAQWVGSLKSQHTQLCNVKTGIEENLKQTAIKELQFGKISRLHKFVSGANAYKTPINNFVLGLTLDDVVFSATRYLSKFSKGRYSLIRADNVGGGGLHGLDIEVKDGHTGGTRKVSTLSGGEMFLASLSLALGLAEVVQSYSGGIMLDSIFIDEGFGSLDSDTLDCAMLALEEIKREGRTVGIISHVPELKERIGARIEISNTERGVRLEVKHLF